MDVNAWNAFVANQGKEIAVALSLGDNAKLTALWRKARLRGVFSRESQFPLQEFIERAKKDVPVASTPTAETPSKELSATSPYEFEDVSGPAWYADSNAMDRAFKSVACPGSGRPEYKGVKEQQTFDQMLQSAWTTESPDAFGAVAEQFSSVNVSLKERAKNIVKAARGRPTSRDTPDDVNGDADPSGGTQVIVVERESSQPRKERSRSRSRSRSREQQQRRSRSRSKDRSSSSGTARKSRSRSRSKGRSSSSSSGTARKSRSRSRSKGRSSGTARKSRSRSRSKGRSSGTARKSRSRSRSKGRSRSRSKGRSRSRSKGRSRSRSKGRSASKSPARSKSVKFSAVEGSMPSLYKRSETILQGAEGAKYTALGKYVVCQDLTEMQRDPNPTLRVIMNTQSIFDMAVDAPSVPDKKSVVHMRLHVMDAPRDIKSQHIREAKPVAVAKLTDIESLRTPYNVDSITIYDLETAIPMSAFHYEVDGGKVPLPVFLHLTVPHPGEPVNVQVGMILSRVERNTRRYGCTVFQCPSSGAALHVIFNFDRDADALNRVVLVQTLPSFTPSSSAVQGFMKPVEVSIDMDNSTAQTSVSFFENVHAPSSGAAAAFQTVNALDYLADGELDAMAKVEGLLDRFGIVPGTNDRAFVLKHDGWKAAIEAGAAGETLRVLRDLVIDAIEKSAGGGDWGALMTQLNGETLDVELSAQTRTSGLTRGVLDRLRRVPPLRRSLPVYRTGQLCAIVLTSDVLRALRLASVRDLVDDKSKSGVVRPVSAKLFIKTDVPRRNVPSGLKFQVAAETVEALRRGSIGTPAVLVGTFLRSAFGNSKANPNVEEGVILTMVASNAEGDFDKAVLYFVRAPNTF